MARSHPMTAVHKIQMGVNLNHMHGLLLGKGVDAGDIDGMIPADHHWQRAGGQNLAHTKFNIGMAFIRFRMDDIGITQINDTHIACEVCRVILMVIGTGMTERK
jgi:hypothetical protein